MSNSLKCYFWTALVLLASIYFVVWNFSDFVSSPGYRYTMINQSISDKSVPAIKVLYKSKSKVSEEPQRDHLSEESLSSHVSEERQRDHLSKESPSNHVSEESQRDHLSEESPSSHVSEEPQRDHLSEESPSNRVSEESQRDHLSKESPSSHVSEEPQRDHLSEESPSNHVSEESQRDRLSEEPYSPKESLSTRLPDESLSNNPVSHTEAPSECAAPMVAPVITRTAPLDTKSFTVNWKTTDPSHKYIVTWTNLLTSVKGNVTVAENTNEYEVTGLSGIDNYDVTVTAINSCGVMMSDPRTVYGSELPGVEIDATQQVIWPPYLDYINMKLTCKAVVRSGHGSVSFVAIKLTGIGLQNSVWVSESGMMLNRDNAEVHILFKPWLASHAGMYTCHLVAKDQQNRIFIMKKTVEVKREYRGLLNSRLISQKFDDTPTEPSKWFPNNKFCGRDEVWQEYADFHASVLTGKQKGKYLIYDCTMQKKDICGGYGNRIQSISILLILAMVTNHVFLIESTFPTDINDYFQTNAIQWNHAVPEGLSTKIMYTGFDGGAASNVANALIQPDEPDVIRVRTFLGTFYYIQLVSDGTLKDMMSKFNLKTLYDFVLLYGCVFNYLFKYQPMIQQRIDSLQKEYNLETKKFITLHVRSHFHENGHPVVNPLHLKVPFKPLFDCAVMAAKSLSRKLNVSKVPIFLAADQSEVTNYANQNHKDMIVFSKAPHFHSDRTEYQGANANKQYHDGLIGVLSDIEIGSKGVALVRSIDSSFSEEIGGIHFLRPEYNLHPFNFYDNSSMCQL